MSELRVHGVALTAGPPQLRVHAMTLAADVDAVIPELRIHLIALTSGVVPGVGEGGIWLWRSGTHVRHIARFWIGGEWV